MKLTLSRAQAEALLVVLDTWSGVKGETLTEVESRLQDGLNNRPATRVCLCGCGRSFRVSKRGRLRRYFDRTCVRKAAQRKSNWSEEEVQQLIQEVDASKQSKHWEKDLRYLVWNRLSIVFQREPKQVRAKYYDLINRGRIAKDEI